MRVDRRKDPRRRAAVDVAIALAELNGSWGDYERALEHLRAADELAGGALADRFASERDEWAARPKRRGDDHVTERVAGARDSDHAGRPARASSR